MPTNGIPSSDPGPRGIQRRGAVPAKPLTKVEGTKDSDPVGEWRQSPPAGYESGAAAPGRSHGRTVPTEWLTKFEGTEAAEHLARLDADAALLTTLELAGFEGRDWNRFAEALAQYGYQVIRAWVATGTIYAKCRHRGFGGTDITQPSWRPDDAEINSLTNETVALAVRGFREKVLMKRRWDPNRGATLKTFFIGQCLMRFPTAFRRWRDQCRPLPSESEEVLRLHPAGDRWDPTHTGIMNDELRRALRDVTKDDNKRAILLLDAQGFSDSEIAEVLGTTTGAVDSFLYRHRRARKGTA